MPVIYITNPGEPIGGMHEIPGHIVRIQPDGRICAFLTPDLSDPICRDNLHRRGSPAGNGNVHRHNCWDINREFEHEWGRARRLEEVVEVMGAASARDRETIAGLQGTVADLRARLAALEIAESPPAKAEKAKKTASA